MAICYHNLSRIGSISKWEYSGENPKVLKIEYAWLSNRISIDEINIPQKLKETVRTEEIKAISIKDNTIEREYIGMPKEGGETEN